MIRDIVGQAWAQSPRRVVAAVLLVPVVAYAAWAWLVVVLTLRGAS